MSKFQLDTKTAGIAVGVIAAGGLLGCLLYRYFKGSSTQALEEKKRVIADVDRLQSLNERRTGLVIVDIQNDYFPGGKFPLEGINEAADNAAKLLDLFRQNQLPVFHIKHEARAAYLVKDTPGSEIHSKVQPKDGEVVITKQEISAFKGTPLQEKLLEERIERLVVCGAMTNMCIDATVRSGSDLGYECVVVQDAVANREWGFDGRIVSAEDVKSAFLGSLDLMYAVIVLTSSVLSLKNRN